MPSQCLALAFCTKLTYLLCVLALLNVVHGVQLALVSIAGHVSALIAVGGAGAWIARKACRAEQVLLLEDVLAIRSLKMGEVLGAPGGSNPQLVVASSRIVFTMKRFHSRVATQRALEFQQWSEAPERRLLSRLINILVVTSAALLVQI